MLKNDIFNVISHRSDRIVVHIERASCHARLLGEFADCDVSHILDLHELLKSSPDCVFGFYDSFVHSAVFHNASKSKNNRTEFPHDFIVSYRYNFCHTLRQFF